MPLHAELKNMNWNNIKLVSGMVAMLGMVTTANLLAQGAGHVAAAAPAATADPTGGIAQAMFSQVFNNPSSLLVVAFLCVFAWLADDLPFLNSRYVAHCTVILGACIYWAFTDVASVPKTFPHPQVVFVANGTLCGFLAFTIHKKAVARIINMVRGHAGTQSTGSN